MKELGQLMLTLLVMVLLADDLVIAQEAANDDLELQTIDEVGPPPGLRDWKPFDNQFRLYVNSDGAAGDSLPRVDILNDKDESWPFWMEHIGETLYVFILPPKCTLEDSVVVRNRVDGLEDEFPFVVWAGTKRVLYWFSYSFGEADIDTTLDQASFIAIVPIREIPNDILTLQLEGKNRNAKIIRSLLKVLGDHAKLVQLEEGFYRDVWFKVRKTVVQNFKTNETKTGTFLALKCQPDSREAVSQVLEKYQRGDYSTAH